MYSNKSTDDLLANLEDELTEMIELSSPRKIFSEIEIEKDLGREKEMPPIPAKRVLSDVPVPAARRPMQMAKSEKNDENEIIQLSSANSSASISENHRNASQNTVVVATAHQVKPFASDIIEIHETESFADDKFFVTKHGKWADDKGTAEIAETELREPLKASSPIKVSEENTKIEIVCEKPTKKSVKRHETPSVASSTTQTSFESSSEESTSEEKKKSKKRKHKDKKKLKKKQSSDEASTTEASSKDDKMENQAIGECFGNGTTSISFNGFPSGVFLHSTGALKFDPNLKGLKLGVSLFNEDSGKQIGDSKTSRPGSFNSDFQYESFKPISRIKLIFILAICCARGTR